MCDYLLGAGGHNVTQCNATLVSGSVVVYRTVIFLDCRLQKVQDEFGEHVSPPMRLEVDLKWIRDHLG